MLDSAATLDAAQALEYRSLMTLAPFVPPDRPALEAQRAALERFAAERVPALEESNGYFSVNNGLHPAIRAYLLGLTEARLGSGARALERAAELDRLPVPEDLGHLVTRPLARSVRAAVHEAAGEGPAALTAFGALDVHYEPAIFSAFYSRAQERWRRAALLEAQGRLDDAARWYRTFRDFSVFDRIYEAPADYRLGLIAERQGDTAEARSRYASVVRLWAGCDPEFRPVLEDARARLARLERQ
jgi:tetratricopeptide (TPR) repeat protein